MDYEIKSLQKERIHFNVWDFEAQQRGEQPILLCDFFSRSLDAYFVKYITGEQKSFGYLFTDSNKLYKNIQASDFYFNELIRRTNDKKFLKEIIRNGVTLPEEFHQQADRAMTNLKQEGNVTSDRLADYWKDLDEGFLKVLPWFWYPWWLAKEDILTIKVRDGLEQHRAEIEKVTEFEEGFLSVIFPLKKTHFQYEQEDMCELVSLAGHREDFETNEAFKEKAAAYLTKYDWLTTFLLVPLLPMTYSQLVERVKRSRKENYVEAFTKQQEDTRKKQVTAQNVLKIVAHDELLVDDIADARELAYALTAGIEEAYMATSKYLTLLQLVAEKMDVAFEDTKYFLSKEIFGILKGTLRLSDVSLDERRKGFVMMTSEGQQYATYGAEGHALSQWIDKELNAIDESIREFKGQIACKGLARGKVRVALSPAGAHLLEEGEILVCPMTNPDYVPAMKRSGAIVTDEGGLLSHAAIMSREFNKPCIIGTKIATRLLKDGDVVEVDATLGTVKVIT